MNCPSSEIKSFTFTMPLEYNSFHIDSDEMQDSDDRLLQTYSCLI